MIRVSDHALVRWLERRHGIDMDFFRDRLAAEIRDAGGEGADAVVVDGLAFVMGEGGYVVTVVPHRALKAYRKRQGRAGE